MLALVLTLVFALSTFHVHASVSVEPDAIVVADIFGDATSTDSEPSKDDPHASLDCPACSTISHVFWAAPVCLVVAPVAGTQSYGLFDDHRVFGLASLNHRPPIAVAT